MKTDKKLKVIDLFSGLGGFSQAFVDRGHEVIRYDNDSEFAEVPYTIIKDVLEIQDLSGADVILASPPCNCFSVMTIGHYWKGGKPDNRARKMINLVKHALRLIDDAKPRYWVLENPAGMLKKAIGDPQILTWWAAWGHPYLKATHLWGLLPNIEWPSRPKKGSYQAAPRGSKLWIQSKDLTPARRALVPYDFSLALCIAAEKGVRLELGL